MSDDWNANNSAEKHGGAEDERPKGELNEPRIRRKITIKERDARDDRNLRDRYGNSRFDPSEPGLVGLHCGVIEAAIKLATKVWRAGETPSPKRVAGKVSEICGLSPAQEKLLRNWLLWLADRKWVLTEGDRSPVAEWVRSGPPVTDIWTEELAAIWRSKIDRKPIAVQQDHRASQPPPSASVQADARAAKAESTPRLAEPGTPPAAPIPAMAPGHSSPIGNPVSRSGPLGQTSGSPTFTAAPAQSRDAVRSVIPEPTRIQASQGQSPSVRPPASATAAVGSQALGSRREMFEGKTLMIPEVSIYFFKKGAQKSNALLNALKSDSFNENNVRTAVHELLQNKEELNEFCRRGPKERDFIDNIFTQIGVKIP